MNQPPMPDWSPLDTSRHQDHVIAHVLGTTALAFFITDEAAHLLLDIGFIWTIYAEGEMALLPQRLALSELDIDEDTLYELREDLERFERDGALELSRISRAPVEFVIREVNLYARGDGRRVVLEGDDEKLVIESSLATGDVRVLLI